MNVWEVQFRAFLLAKDEGRAIQALNEGFPINFRLKTGPTYPLILAIDLALKQVTTWLVSARASVHTTDQSGRTALLAAAQAGDLALMQQLIRAGADPLREDYLGNTIVHLAAAKGHLEVVDYAVNTLGLSRARRNLRGQLPRNVAKSGRTVSITKLDEYEGTLRLLWKPPTLHKIHRSHEFMTYLGKKSTRTVSSYLNKKQSSFYRSYQNTSIPRRLNYL